MEGFSRPESHSSAIEFKTFAIELLNPFLLFNMSSMLPSGPQTCSRQNINQNVINEKVWQGKKCARRSLFLANKIVHLRMNSKPFLNHSLRKA